MGAGSSYHRAMFGSSYRKAKRSDCTQPPRTRSNLDTTLPHNAYPGGKTLRRALARLKWRNERHGENIAKPHEQGNSFYKPGSPSRQLAGSMKP